MSTTIDDQRLAQYELEERRYLAHEYQRGLLEAHKRIVAEHRRLIFQEDTPMLEPGQAYDRIGQMSGLLLAASILQDLTRESSEGESRG